MSDWKVYRTRFLIRARQIAEPILVRDEIGRLQSGQPGDYLVECSDGSQRVSPRHVFEDVYVEMSGVEQRRSAVPIRKIPVQPGNPAD